MRENPPERIRTAAVHLPVSPAGRYYSRMIRIGVLACVGLIAFPQELPHGRIVDDVKCTADPSQSYALYLPSAYAPDRAWPVLMGFHPGARGRAIVEKYQAAAEQYLSL